MPFYLRGRIFLTALPPTSSPQSGRGRLWGNRRFLPHLSEAVLPHKILLCKPKKASIRMPFSFGGRRWIRTIEVSDNRFTVCPLWPLGNSPIYKPNRSWIVLWSWWTASNPRPADYKSAALPAELHQLGFDKCYSIITIYQCQAFFEFFYSADFPSSTLRSRLGFYILYGVNEPAFRLPVPALPDCRTGSHSSGNPLPR